MHIQTTDVQDFGSAEVEFMHALAGQVAGIIELNAVYLKLARRLTLEQEAVKRLTSLNASKSDLLAMLSHDFRGPLSIAKSYVFGLMARLNEPDRAACRELESELDSLSLMTDHLMLSLELEFQHQLVLVLEQFDMVDVICEVCRGLRRTSPEHAILFDPQVDTRAVVADRSKIRLVVVNVVGNATKETCQAVDGCVASIFLIGPD